MPDLNWEFNSQPVIMEARMLLTAQSWQSTHNFIIRVCNFKDPLKTVEGNFFVFHYLTYAIKNSLRLKI